MRKNILIFFGILFLSSFVNSQDIFINGKVINFNNRKPLQYVNIHIKGTNIGTVSNIEGMFFLPILKKNEKDTIVFSYIGYGNIMLVIKDIKNDILIKLEPYVKQTKSIIIEAKRTNPVDILKKASNNIKENIYDSIYNTRVFTRNFIKKDTSFISYRKTLGNILAINDDLWFIKGEIIADKYLSYSSWIKNIDKNIINTYTLNSPPIDYMRAEISNKTYKKNTIKIDTVIFSENNKIYVIDVFSKKIDDVTLSNIYNIIEKTQTPYTLIFDTCIQHTGKYFIQNKNIHFLRFFIDAKQNYNIIKQLVFFVSSTGNKKTFEYIISEFSNLPKKSTVKHIVSFKENSIFKKNTQPLYFKSLFESFCYNEDYDIRTSNYSDKIIRKQYLEKINLNKLTSYDNWNNHDIYIKTDKLEIEAIKQIENTIKLQNEE